jgi:DNA polymerase-3 subunit gamma/tau
MGYQVLARKYRPQRFADVAGQDHVTHTLLNALSQNRIAHGYIFSGHRGIGKTTIARILAQALNCRNQVGSAERPTPEPCGVCDSCVEVRQGNAVDVIEIDAATNRGIDEIRELRDAARYAPARDRYKIYILDEAHQITEAAFNALLKTLEEPPSHVVFMMATTEPENIPQTIRSRCQHFSFHAVKFDDILAQLKMIAEAEQVSAEEESLALLAEAGDGSMRDALSIMDQAIACAQVVNGRPMVAAAEIRELMGSVPNTVFERLLEAVAQGQSAELMEQLSILLNAGHSPQALARQMVRYLRNSLMAKLGGEQTELLQISTDERARAARSALLFTEEELTRNLQIVLRTFDDLNYRQEQRLHLELGLLKLIHAQRLLPIEELLSGATTSSRASSAPASAPRAPVSTPRHTSSAAAPAPASSASRSISPFESSQSSWNSGPSLKQSVAAEPVSVAVAPITEGALAKLPVAETESAGAPGIESLRNAIVSALANSGRASAAELLNNAVWTINGSSLHVDVPGVGQRMLSLTVNAATEKIIKQELQRLGGPTKFTAIPGAGSAPASSAPPPVAAGSIHETALAHPLVQRAREIFHAEVRSVVDLREKP